MSPDGKNASFLTKVRGRGKNRGGSKRKRKKLANKLLQLIITFAMLFSAGAFKL